MTVCFGLFLYSFYFNENIMSYIGVLWIKISNNPNISHVLPQK